MRASMKALLVVGLLALLAGSTPAQRQPFPFGGTGLGGPAMLLMNKDVQAELKLTKEQTEKLGDMQGKMVEKITGIFSKLQDIKPEERTEKVQAMMKEATQEVEKMAKEVLKPEQVKRLKQIERQQAGVAAFSEEEVQKALQLTADQKDKIRTITDDLGKDTKELMKGITRQDFQKMADARKKAAALGREAREKVTTLLSADQKKAWNDLIGEPFELKLEGFSFPLRPDKP